MNNEAGSSSAAPPDVPHDDDATHESTGTAASSAPSFFFSRKPRLVDLVATLDRIAWVEIVVLYLIDNSFVRFALRAATQGVWLTPRPIGFPDQNPQHPYLAGIIGSNVICMILHICFERPQAGEATRGYLNGSLILDFIGQKGPTSLSHLLLLDTIILAVQLVAMAAAMENQALDKAKKAASTLENVEPNTQDHDAEERGEVRGASAMLDSAEQDEEEDTTGLQGLAQRKDTLADPFAVSDVIASGQAVVADFYIADTMRKQYIGYKQTPANGSNTQSGFFSDFRDFRGEMQRRRPNLQLPGNAG